MTETAAAAVVADDSLRREELAAFLRARRRALQPEDVGLPRMSRRRVAGLRREEVAELASVSVTWYTWLEQGRDIRTTAQVLDALGRSLRLDEAGLRHLRRLGGHPLGATSTHVETSDHSDEGLRALVEAQMPSPALLVRPNGDLVAWNQAVSKLWVDPETLEPELRNGLIMLTNEALRTRIEDWEDHCRRAIAGLRAEAGKRLGDARNAELVERLRELSALFRDVWPEHEVQRIGQAPMTSCHPDVGRITTQHYALRPIGYGSYILLVHRFTDEESRNRMLQLLESSG